MASSELLQPGERPIAVFKGSLALTLAALVTAGLLIVPSEAFGVEVEPSISISSPSEGFATGKSLEVTIDLSAAEGFAVMRKTLELCPESYNRCNYAYPKDGITTKLGKGSVIANSDESIVITQEPGTYRLSVGYGLFALTQDQTEYPAICSSVYHENSCFYSQASVLVTFTESEEVLTVPLETLKNELVDYQTELNLKCPKNIKKKFFRCTINPVVIPAEYSAYKDFTVTGITPVYVCLFDWRAVRDNCETLGDNGKGYNAVYKQILFDIPLNQSKSIKIPKWPTPYFALEVEVDGGFGSGSWTTRSTSSKKGLQVKITGQKDVTYGETTTFSIRISPSLTATCKVYRYYGGFYSLVATARITKGKGSGSHRWLWNDDWKATAITLTANCESSTHAGIGYLLVNAYPTG
jgi:hypothetical protein